MIVLSGDIGGTSTRLQLTDFSDAKSPNILAEAAYRSAEHSSLREIVHQFMVNQKGVSVNHACFAIAGPIIDGHVKLTNLPWRISESFLKDSLDIPHVKLINDFEAIGHGLSTLSEEDCATLQAGQSQPTGVRAIIGAGTGLGMALMVQHGDKNTVISTEGGHVDFAPTDDEQVALLAYLRKKFHRVSFERIVSGKGFMHIYKFVRSHPVYGEREHPELQRLSYLKEDFSADISRFAIKEHDPMALRTLDIFLRCYGAISGNLALSSLPYGGLYIVGGMAPKLFSSMKDGRFVEAFLDKGRMSNLLRKIPVHVVLNTKIGLTGAAYYAAFLIGESE